MFNWSRTVLATYNRLNFSSDYYDEFAELEEVLNDLDVAGLTLNVSHNFWGSGILSEVSNRIKGAHNTDGLPTVIFSPILDRPPIEFGISGTDAPTYILFKTSRDY